jgi:hypothetical protein
VPFLIIIELFLFMKSPLTHDSSSSSNTHMDTSDHGLLQKFKGLAAIANVLTSIKNELVRTFFLCLEQGHSLLEFVLSFQVHPVYRLIFTCKNVALFAQFVYLLSMIRIINSN